MNFQPSVIIWTVICFALLMAILRNLLFKPVLQILDERKAKIDSAREKKAEIEKLIVEHEAEVVLFKQQELQRQKAQAKELTYKIQSQGKKEIEAAQRQCLEDIEKYRKEIAVEHEQIVESVAPKMETAAAIFAKNIITHRV